MFLSHCPDCLFSHISAVSPSAKFQNNAQESTYKSPSESSNYTGYVMAGWYHAIPHSLTTMYINVSINTNQYNQ